MSRTVSPGVASGDRRPELHPLLATLFADWCAASVPFVLLRVPSNVEAPTGDVDVLVDPRHVPRLRDLAQRRGFVVVPGWESARNTLLATYHSDTGNWLLLDVVSRVTFANGRLQLPVAADVLARRQTADGMVVPASDDAFWLLILHCLLDRGRVAEHYRARLREAAATDPGGVVRAALVAQRGTDVAAAAVVDATRRADWLALASAGRGLDATWRSRLPLTTRLGGLASPFARYARWPGLLARRRGLSVALLGPNGVGKSTLADALERGFPLPSRRIYMGLWKVDDGLPPPVAALLRVPRAWARFAAGEYHRIRGRLVIFDRYVHEARLPAQPPLLRLKRAYFWLLARSCPSPDWVFILDVPGKLAYRRKQENPPDELERERTLYRGLADVLPRTSLIDASRDASAVQAEVSTRVWQLQSRRWRKADARHAGDHD